MINNPIGGLLVPTITSAIPTGEVVTDKIANSNAMLEVQFNGNIGLLGILVNYNMSWMFMENAFNQNIGSWDVSSLNHMNGQMFKNADSYNQNIGFKWKYILCY